LRGDFYKWSWNEVYDFIEFVAQNHPNEDLNNSFMENCNIVLEREMSAYRFVGGVIAPITSEEELSAINEALTAKISPVRAHLNSALEKLTDRKNPDYRNSIKESISSVEALATKVTKTDNGTLGQLLKVMEKKTDLHPALKGAFEKLYGYTSDADGIRHALLEEDTVSFDQAKFMLVVCSAFTNYVMGILKKEL
jgi:AbiJ-like protein